MLHRVVILYQLKYARMSATYMYEYLRRAMQCVTTAFCSKDKIDFYSYELAYDRSLDVNSVLNTKV